MIADWWRLTLTLAGVGLICVLFQSLHLRLRPSERKTVCYVELSVELVTSNCTNKTAIKRYTFLHSFMLLFCVSVYPAILQHVLGFWHPFNALHEQLRCVISQPTDKLPPAPRWSWAFAWLLWFAVYRSEREEGRLSYAATWSDPPPNQLTRADALGW